MSRSNTMKSFLLLILLTCLLPACNQAPPPGPGAPQGGAPVRASASVSVVKVTAGPAPILVRFTGSVRMDDSLEVAAEVPGRLKSIAAVEGRDVTAGEELFLLDDQEYKLREQQADAARETAVKNREQLALAADLEARSLTLGVNQAQEALAQIQARARVLEEGARPQEKDQVRALVEMSRTRVDAARRDLERMQGLLTSSVIPRQRFEQSEDTYKVAKAEHRHAARQLELLNLGARQEDRDAMQAAVRQAETALEQARVAQGRVDATRVALEAADIAVRQAELARDLARFQSSRTRVTAPLSGRIEKVLLEPGTVVTPGKPVLRILPTGRAELAIQVRGEDRQVLRAGLTATYLADALPGEGPFSATIRQIGEEADPSTLRFPVYLEPAAPERPRLKAGMFVRGEIRVGDKPAALLVPTLSILRLEGRKVLFVVADGKAAKRYVTTGMRAGDQTEILEGLTSGEMVIVDGQVGLVDGQPVRVRDDSEPETGRGEAR